MQNQLLLLPLSGLPQIPKSIFSILPSSTWQVHSHSDQQSFHIWILPEQNSPPYTRQLPAIFRVFSFFLYFTVRCQNPISPRKQQRERVPTPTSICCRRREAVIFYTLCFLSSQQVGCHFRGMFGRDKKCLTKSTLLLSTVCRSL